MISRNKEKGISSSVMGVNTWGSSRVAVLLEEEHIISMIK